VATLVELTTLITAWGEARGIVANSTPFAQACKTHEELRELVEARASMDACNTEAFGDYVTELQDAIGDVYVTLVMVCSCNKTPVTGFEYEYCPPDVNPNAVKAVYEYFTNLLQACALCNGIESSQTVQFEAVNMIGLLHDVCEHYDFDFTECVEHAYESIKDRKGYLRPDGVFVKETT
jgi:hypothetical protein